MSLQGVARWWESPYDYDVLGSVDFPCPYQNQYAGLSSEKED